MIVLGIDPGNKPGYGWLIPNCAIWFTAKRRPDISPHVVVTEGVWHASKKKGGAPPAAISTLAFTCGRQISGWGVAKCYRLPVKLWKDTVIYNGNSLPKGIFVRQLRRLLGLPEVLSEDEVEACGIAHAWALLLHPVREKHLLKEAP